MLYLRDVADEFVLGNVGKYERKPLVSADQVKPEDLKNVGTNAADNKPEIVGKETAIGLLTARFKESLGDRVSDVRSSERLVDSPACLVTNDEHMSGHIEKLMRIMNKSTDLPKRVLELNPAHPLIRRLSELADKDLSDPFIAQACEQVFEGCMLIDGYLTDPHQLVEL